MFYLSKCLCSKVTTLQSERTDNQLLSLGLNLVYGEQRNIWTVQQIHTVWFSSIKEQYTDCCGEKAQSPYLQFLCLVYLLPHWLTSNIVPFTGILLHLAYRAHSLLHINHHNIHLMLQQHLHSHPWPRGCLVRTNWTVKSNLFKNEAKDLGISINLWFRVTALESGLNFKCHPATNYNLNCNSPHLIALIIIQWNTKRLLLDLFRF